MEASDSQKKTHLYLKPFMILMPLMLLVLVFVLPINRVPDEMNHAKMTWELVYEKTSNSFDWFHSVDDGKEFSRREYLELFTDKIDLSKEKVNIHISPSNIVHFPQLLGMLLGRILYPSIGVIVTLGRLMNAIVYVLLGYLAIKKARYGKSVIFFVMMIPQMLQQAASLSYDVVNFGAVLFFFVLLTDLSIKPILSKRNLLFIVLSVILLYLSKMNNVLLIFLLLTIGLRFPKEKAQWNKGIDHLKDFYLKHRYIYTFFAALVIFCLAWIYFQSKGGMLHFIFVMINTLLNNDANGHLNTILTIGIFGFFGNFQAQMPLWMIFIDVALLTILMIKDRQVELNKVFGIGSGLMFPLQVAAIVGGMYFAWTPLVLGDNAPISVGAQGRYFTPFLLFLLPFAISFKDKVTARVNELAIRNLTVAIIGINFLLMVGLILDTYWRLGLGNLLK